MLRSMYSGISGLRNFQTKLDVIGNNIANVNTHGFKKGRVIFKDLISQTQSGASGATATRGGVNPKQVGLGAQMAAIDTMHGGGSMQSTGNVLDLGIEGDGFFIVADSTGSGRDENGNIQPGDDDGAFTGLVYTRAGNFYMDDDGYLVNVDGKYLYGHANSTIYTKIEGIEGADPNDDKESSFDEDKGANGLTGTTGDLSGEDLDLGPIRIPKDAESMSIGQDGTISYVDAAGSLQYAGQLIMGKFSNPGGLNKIGGNYYQPTANSGEVLQQVATVAGMGTVQSGWLEMSNVDLSEEFTEMIVAQRGFQANTRIITTSDEILQELVNLKR